jgi:hypothetical protein
MSSTCEESCTERQCKPNLRISDDINTEDKKFMFDGWENRPTSASLWSTQIAICLSRDVVIRKEARRGVLLFWRNALNHTDRPARNQMAKENEYVEMWLSLRADGCEVKEVLTIWMSCVWQNRSWPFTFRVTRNVTGLRFWSIFFIEIVEEWRMCVLYVIHVRLESWSQLKVSLNWVFNLKPLAFKFALPEFHLQCSTFNKPHTYVLRLDSIYKENNRWKGRNAWPNVYHMFIKSKREYAYTPQVQKYAYSPSPITHGTDCLQDSDGWMFVCSCIIRSYIFPSWWPTIIV